jgi:hypothetical protein
MGSIRGKKKKKNVTHKFCSKGALGNEKHLRTTAVEN